MARLQAIRRAPFEARTRRELVYVVGSAGLAAMAFAALGARGLAAGERVLDLGVGDRRGFWAQTQVGARELEADGCTVEVLGPNEMAGLGMNMLLGVGQGATHEPRLVAIKLPGWASAPEDAKRLAIVGKGVCFDSGGLSLKPPEGMGDMKMDRSGAAAVIAAARETRAVRRLQRRSATAGPR